MVTGLSTPITLFPAGVRMQGTQRTQALGDLAPLLRAAVPVLVGSALACCGMPAVSDAEPRFLPDGPVAHRLIIPPADTPFSARALWSGLPFLRAVVGSEREWEELFSHLESPPARVKVDYAAEMLLVAAAGEQYEGNYRITIDTVNVARDTIRAVVTDHLPAPGGPMLAPVTPWAVVAIPRAANPVVFIDRDVQQPPRRHPPRSRSGPKGAR